MSVLIKLLTFVLEILCPVLTRIFVKYKLDYGLLQLAHVFNIKTNMDIPCKDAISAHIHMKSGKLY